MYETLFDLTETLCQRFPALSPFTIRRERAGEVFLLVRRVNAKTAREGANGAGAGASHGNIRRDAKGNIHIRRRASDNMIF